MRAVISITGPQASKIYWRDNQEMGGNAMSIQPRYDEETRIYRDCKWCGGKGCQFCPAECEKEYKRQFPNGPVPVATFDTTTPQGVEKAKAFMRNILNPPPLSPAEQSIIDQIKNGMGAR
jgi:hypothetical protein